MQGFLPICKPPGMSSSNVVTAVKRLLHGEKIGHAGTLDPMAAGVLPLMIGRATRLFDEAGGQEKEYIAGIRFGLSTDTQDGEGRVLARSGERPSDAALQAVLPRFTGDLLQVPPAYSALKQDGRKLYELAREGKPVTKPPRPVHIGELVLLERLSPDEALLRVRCGKGTYIRTLCQDIGEALGCPAHMGFLLRTQVGVFDLARSYALEEVTEERLPGLLMPMDAPLGHLPRLNAKTSAERACRNGNPLAWNQLEPTPCADIPVGTKVRIYLRQDFLGLGRVTETGITFEALLKQWGEL